MAEGERATGTPNTIYDLSSVLFHALEGGASYDQYIRDAEGAGDEELAGFFRQVRDEDSRRADEAQRLLAERTSATAGRAEGATTAPVGGAASTSSMTEPSGTPPGAAEELPPTRAGEETSATGGVSRGAEPIGTSPQDTPPGRAEETAPPRPEPSDDFPGTEPIREEVPPAGMERLPPTAEGAVPPRMEDVPTAEEIPSGIPAQAPPGEVPRAEEERAEREEGEEDKGLIDRARDYLRGEDRERDYPPRRGE